MEKKTTMHFTLTGRVQRVGMRFFISRTAKKFNLTGYVKNVRDGSVKGVVEGDEDTLEAFITHVKENAPGKIETFDIKKEVSTSKYTSFKVKLF